MDIKQTKTGFANLPDEKKEIAVKVQMPKVLRGSLTKQIC
jgi:hypothetical protein